MTEESQHLMSWRGSSTPLARVLNNGFKEIYGCSINTYISGQRLDSAHEVLVKSDIPMKTLAVNLGYSHVNHFITAFRKKFGYSPGSLRR